MLHGNDLYKLGVGNIFKYNNQCLFAKMNMEHDKCKKKIIDINRHKCVVDYIQSLSKKQSLFKYYNVLILFNVLTFIRIQSFHGILNPEKDLLQNNYKKHIDASVKERPQILLVPSEEICKPVLCNKHI